MKDAIGNVIERNQTLYWKPKEITAQVIDVVEPVIAGNMEPPMLTIAIRIPINVPPEMRNRLSDIGLEDFIVVKDPMEAARKIITDAVGERSPGSVMQMPSKDKKPS